MAGWRDGALGESGSAVQCAGCKAGWVAAKLSHGSGNKTRDEQQGSFPQSGALSGGFAVANNKAQAS